MHLLEAAGGRFLLDAGLFQGRRARPGTLNLRLPVRRPPARRGRAEPRPHRSLGPAPAAGEGRLPRPDPRHPGHPRSLRGDAGRRGAHPGEGLRVPPAPRQGGRPERAALLAGRRHRGPGPHGRRALPADHPPAEAPRARVSRRRPHPRLGLGGHPDHRGREPPPGVLRRHRPERAPDRSRPRAAFRAGRHPDHRGHLRRPEPRVGGRRGGAAGRGGAPGRRAGRQGAGPRLRPRAGPRSWSTACTSSSGPGRSPRSRSTWTARSRWTSPPCSGCTPRSSTSGSA